jgi:ABC-type transport system involved in multi-copper enzyme maturation permease subunit
MWNTIAAAFQLATLQVIGRKRRLVTIIVFLLPFVLALIVRRFGAPDTNLGYSAVVSGMLAMFLIPFVAVFWGSALLTDEVEGKTLVFLWTRPAGRSRLFVLKYIAVVLWIFLLSAVAILSTYLVIYSRTSFSNVADNLMVTIWDIRALALGGACYAALSFLFATLFKKPVTIGLLYAYLFDSLANVLPGFMKRFSIRHNVLSLASHPTPDHPRGVFAKVMAEANTTESEAMLTLVIASLALLIAGALILRQKEYLGDDPARTQ